MKEEDTSTHPLPEPSPVEHGGRVELRLVTGPSADSPQARFSARWFTASQRVEGHVTVDLTDKVVVSLDPLEALPEWLGTFTSNLVRTTARQAQKENTWPRRLTRWRAAPAARKP